MAPFDAFMLGFKFATRIRDCWDSRDIGRVLTCEDFPVEVQSLANELDGFKGKGEGVAQAISLIRVVLDNEPESEA